MWILLILKKWNKEGMDNNIFDWVVNNTRTIKDENYPICEKGPFEENQINVVCVECPYRKDFRRFGFWNHMRASHNKQTCICLLCKSIHQSIPGLKQHVKRYHKTIWKLVWKKSIDRKMNSIKKDHNLEAPNAKIKSDISYPSDLFYKECGFLAGSTLTWKRHIEYSHWDKKKHALWYQAVSKR